MRSAVDGEKAISKLHKKRLGNSILKVSVKLTREEKERRQNLREVCLFFSSFISVLIVLK